MIPSGQLDKHWTIFHFLHACLPNKKL